MIKFKDEKEFQIALGRLLKEYGFEVYTDKKICELPTFTGDREKPDLLVFFKEDKTTHKIISINKPFAIECKKPDKLNQITKAILQVKKYNGKKYTAGNWSGEITNVFLTTSLCFINGNLYEWSLRDKGFNEGLNWGLCHTLFSVSNKSGIILKENDEILIRFHNCNFKLDFGGILTRPENNKIYHPIKKEIIK